MASALNAVELERNRLSERQKEKPFQKGKVSDNQRSQCICASKFLLQETREKRQLTAVSAKSEALGHTVKNLSLTLSV